MVEDQEGRVSRVNAWGNALMRFMISGDVDAARRRMRYAWLAGFIFASIFFFNAVAVYFGIDQEGRPLWTGGQFAFAMIQSISTAALSYGVMRRSRAAAALLFFSFLLINIVALFIGLSQPLKLLAWLIVFGALFFQGMRGALSFHYLTHPDYPKGLGASCGDEEYHRPADIS